MTSLFRRASKLIKQNSSNIDGIDELSQTSSIDVSSVAKKGLFSGLAKKGQSSGDQVPLVENSPTATTTTNPVAGFLRKNTISRRDTVAKNKEAEKEKEKETLADASSALASARRARSNHSLNEEAKDLMGELDYTQAPATPAIPSMDLTKKATVGRSVTTGAKKPSRFNKIEAKNALDEQEPAIRKSAALLSVTRDNSGYTGRTSVTSINKKTPSSHNISKLGTDSITAKESNNSVFSYTEAPPIPLPLSIPQTDSSGLPKLPTKLSSTAAAIASLPQHSIPITAKSRALTEQPTTSNLFAASKSSANLNFNPSSSSIPKKQHPLQTHSSINNDSQKQLTAAGANLLTTSARQEKRNAGLSAYEISGPKENAITQTSLKRYTLDDWHIVRRVGRGGFAIVFLVRQKGSTGRYFALKAIRKAEVVKLKQEKQIVNEKEILKNVRHNFIVELFYTFQDTHYLYMVMEYIDGGDLFSYLRKVQKFGDEDSKFYAAEVLMSLQYLHSENVVFRDLKPENILLDMTGHVKLADFGFAKVITNTTKSFCGTPDYIAREIVLNRSYTKAVDWWSFGVLIFELVSGKTPFASESPDGIYDNIENCRISWNSLIKGSCKDIVARLLEKDPEKRLGSNGDGVEIRMHPWFKTIKWAKAEVRQMQPPFLPACEPPDVIERERKEKGQIEDYAGMLKSGAGGGASATDKRADLSWLTNLQSDPFKNF